MKKLLLAVIAGVLLFCLGGCGDKGASPAPSETTTELNHNFSAKADIKFGDLTATADINRTAPDAFTAVLNSPAALKGMTFTYQGETIRVSYKGLSVDLNEDGFAARAMTSAVVKALDSAAKDTGASVKVKGNTVEIAGKNDNGEFTLTLDKKTGSALKLKIPSLDLECKFGDFTFLK